MPTQTIEEVIIESTPAFFEGVFLYQQPTAYSHLFKPGAAPVSQDTVAVAPLALSHKLEIEMKEDIIRVVNFTGVYNQEELTLYFNSLREILITHPGPVALMLENSNHAITVGFDPAYPDKWIFIEANKCRDKKIIEMKLDIVNCLLAKNCPPDTARIKDKMTPLHLAVIKGYTDIAESLLQAGAKLNQEIMNELPMIGTIPRENRTKLMGLFKKYSSQSMNKPSNSSA